MTDFSERSGVDVALPVDRCYRIAADVDHLDWHPTMTEVTVHERDAEGRPVSVSSQLDVQVTRLRSDLTFSYRPSVEVAWVQHSGDLTAMSGSWSSEEFTDELTRVTYLLEVEYSPRLKLAAKEPMRKLMRHILVEKPVRGFATAAGGVSRETSGDRP